MAKMLLSDPGFYQGKIYVDIREGSLENGGSNESGVVENGDFRFFRSSYLSNFHIQGHNILLYCTIYR